MEFRKAAAEYMNREYGLSVTGDTWSAGPGAKKFEQLFCEAFLNPGDGVLCSARTSPPIRRIFSGATRG